MSDKRISDLTPKGSSIGATDLFEVSVSSGGGSYVSHSITGAEMATPVTNFIPGFINGMVPTPTTIAITTISPGSAISSDHTMLITSASNINNNITISGVNGLDTGTVAANTQYGIYIIGDSTGVSVTASVSSLNYGIGTVPSVFPAGYNEARFIGTIKTDAGSHLYSQLTTGISNDRIVKIYPTSGSSVLASGHATSATNVDCSAWVPNTSSVTRLILLAAVQGTIGDTASILPAGFSNQPVVITSISGTAFNSHYLEIDCVTPMTTAIQYFVTNGTDSLNLSVLGYYLSV